MIDAGNIIEINGIRMISCDFSAACEEITDHLDNSSEKRVFTHINFYNYYVLYARPDLAKELKKISVFFFDGIFMKLAAFILGWGLRNDLNGTDMYPQLIKEMCKKSYSVYLLGGSEKVSGCAAQNLRNRFQGLKIAGRHDGYFSQKDEFSVVEEINSSDADLLIISMGMSREAEFLARNFYSINSRAIWNVGGLFDFISGNKPRAPKALRALKLEWLFRFMIEPARMFFRYFVLPWWGLAHFIKLRLR